VRNIGSVNGSGDGQLDRPIGIAAGAGWVAVTDASDRVSVFSCADGSFLHRWGSTGSNGNQLDGPGLLCWSESHGVLVVPDASNHRVTTFQ
jgi:hypothetical protein